MLCPGHFIIIFADSTHHGSVNFANWHSPYTVIRRSHNKYADMHLVPTGRTKMTVRAFDQSKALSGTAQTSSHTSFNDALSLSMMTRLEADLDSSNAVFQRAFVEKWFDGVSQLSSCSLLIGDADHAVDQLGDMMESMHISDLQTSSETTTPNPFAVRKDTNKGSIARATLAMMSTLSHSNRFAETKLMQTGASLLCNVKEELIACRKWKTCTQDPARLTYDDAIDEELEAEALLSRQIVLTDQEWEEAKQRMQQDSILLSVVFNSDFTAQVNSASSKENASSNQCSPHLSDTGFWSEESLLFSPTRGGMELLVDHCPSTDLVESHSAPKCIAGFTPPDAATIEEIQEHNSTPEKLRVPESHGFTLPISAYITGPRSKTKSSATLLFGFFPLDSAHTVDPQSKPKVSVPPPLDSAHTVGPQSKPKVSVPPPLNPQSKLQVSVPPGFAPLDSAHTVGPQSKLQVSVPPGFAPLDSAHTVGPQSKPKVSVPPGLTPFDSAYAAGAQKVSVPPGFAPLDSASEAGPQRKSMVSVLPGLAPLRLYTAIPQRKSKVSVPPGFPPLDFASAAGPQRKPKVSVPPGFAPLYTSIPQSKPKVSVPPGFTPLDSASPQSKRNMSVPPGFASLDSAYAVSPQSKPKVSVPPGFAPLNSADPQSKPMVSVPPGFSPLDSAYTAGAQNKSNVSVPPGFAPLDSAYAVSPPIKPKVSVPPGFAPLNTAGPQSKPEVSKPPEFTPLDSACTAGPQIRPKLHPDFDSAFPASCLAVPVPFPVQLAFSSFHSQMPPHLRFALQNVVPYAFGSQKDCMKSILSLGKRSRTGAGMNENSEIDFNASSLHSSVLNSCTYQKLRDINKRHRLNFEDDSECFTYLSDTVSEETYLYGCRSQSAGKDGPPLLEAGHCGNFQPVFVGVDTGICLHRRASHSDVDPKTSTFTSNRHDPYTWEEECLCDDAENDHKQFNDYSIMDNTAFLEEELDTFDDLEPLTGTAQSPPTAATSAGSEPPRLTIDDNLSSFIEQEPVEVCKRNYSLYNTVCAWLQDCQFAGCVGTPGNVPPCI